MWPLTVCDRTIALSVLAAACVVMPSRAASAQTYPTKPIRIIVPTAPGGGTDTVARIVGQKLSEKFGPSVVVDNRAGAAGIIGTDIVAKAARDGYTLLVSAGVHAINQSLYSKLPYDVRTDFANVAFLLNGSGMLVVNPSVPATAVRELIALARRNRRRSTMARAAPAARRIWRPSFSPAWRAWR